MVVCERARGVVVFSNSCRALVEITRADGLEYHGVENYCHVFIENNAFWSTVVTPIELGNSLRRKFF